MGGAKKNPLGIAFASIPDAQIWIGVHVTDPTGIGPQWVAVIGPRASELGELSLAIIGNAVGDTLHEITGAIPGSRDN